MNGKLGNVLIVAIVLFSSYCSILQAQVSDCSVNGKQCENGGQCVGSGDSSPPFCSCREGFYGEYCENEEPKDEFCSVQGRCGSHGKCIRAGDKVPAFCLCQNGYKGTYCEYSTQSFCSEPGTCKNGGVCIEGGDGRDSFCSCPEPYTGKYCESTA